MPEADSEGRSSAGSLAQVLAAPGRRRYSPDEPMMSLSDRSHGPRPPIELLRDASLFLDFDGTLVDIAPRPDSVRVSAELADLLTRLEARLGGRLAILTGRSIADVEQLLGPLPFAVGGQHGLETRRGGRLGGDVGRPEVLDSVVSGLRQLEREFPGVLVEDKPLGVALHYRQAPHAEDACRSAAEAASRQSGLEIQPGKMVFELKPKGANKGDALAAMMADPPFAGTRPVFVGDDLTDEPAFAAAQGLGGAGIIVGDRAPTKAHYRVESVEEALAWLRQACELA